jgi:hypothetical protein
MMAEALQVGDRVEVYLDAKFGEKEGWHPGTIHQIDPYTKHRSFYWIRFDEQARVFLGMSQISVLNPRNIRKV